MITWKKHFLYQIDYQHWANDQLFAAMDQLDERALNQLGNLYYDTALGMANHMLVTLLNWWARMQGIVAPHAQTTQLHADWRAMKQALRQETRAFQHWLEKQPEQFFEDSITYHNTANHQQTSWVPDVLTHVMTNLAHHRGQLAAMATRQGAPLPEMEFIAYRREMADHLMRLKEQQV
ncbi:putative damage-inducible protein DinB [Chitinivorax tropicus]|uniref:Putative damage-inducible protein DinB n=1 Tax=Chitinivorax tropicus TaxID=714531 RepID=A0A840MPN0_9PROT|nr:DinB family protein [Chitinivorax tropicus]MBB5017201.1 putative damage-inducible protein DinB [Chitinivorax tropicus]